MIGDHHRPGQPARQARRLRMRAGGHREPQLEPETRSAPLFALDPDAAVHHLDQPARDREAEAGAFEMAVGFALDLVEFAKYQLGLFGGDADAGILDRDMDRGLLPRAFGHAGHADQHMALQREFHGVSNEIGQHLADPPRVADEMGRQEDVVVDQHRQSLVAGGGLQQRDDLVDAAFQVEGLGMQHQLLGLDLGIIQHVVDDHQQRLARIADGRDIKPLFLGQVAVGQQFGHADDAVHRRADLVAHVGEEGGFGAVGGLGPLALGLELFLVADGFGDVQRQAAHVAAMAALIDEPEVFVVPEPDVDRFGPRRLPALGHHLAPVGGMQIAGVDDAFLGHHLQDAGIGDAGRDFIHVLEQGEIGGIGPDHDVVGIEERKAVADRLDRMPQTAFGDLDLLVGSAQIRTETFVFIPNGRDLGLGPADLLGQRQRMAA